MKINLMALATIAAVSTSPTLAGAEDAWTGFYAGLHIAATDGDLRSGSAKISDHSDVYGVQAGYNHSLNNGWVVGGELSYSTAEFPAFGSMKDVDTTRAKAKIGHDFGNLLAYGVLGYAQVDAGNQSEGGVTYGIGVGYKATDNIILSAEVLRDSVDFNTSGTKVNADYTSLIFGASYKF
ncbi:outer membrane beta-barrel protein [Pseudophaeobacter sp.]|uniref:outer membrane protein n=1 Tax=Pseudophaeobacter sp. TaxID=1971739 RepID=UPI003299821B